MNNPLNQNMPYVSIGLPVYNGEDFLQDSVDSLLSQTYQDFELVICDNASTDNTEEICRNYVSKDNRVRYYRNPRNLGAPMNYNRTVRLSRGKYFKWAAADDVHAPDYLRRCVEILDTDPSVVLCHTKTSRIDEKGLITGTYEHSMRISSTKIEERFGDLISIMTNLCWSIFGVMRKEILEKTPLHGDYRGADANLLAELSLYGRLYEIPEYLFLRRDHLHSYTQQFCANKKFKSKGLAQQKAWWSNKSWFNYTNFKNCYEFFSSVNRVQLTPSERMLCYREIFRWFYKEGWKLFGNDVEQYLLSRSIFGRTSIKVVKSLLGYMGICIIEKDN
ncbi:MAG TPA: glycosyltransferase family 2 protein [Anaerovoracaceae bacterium]|nr:glycosyltransferase family 2 protein [Anaerovoracaceae bacterium]